MKKLNIVVDCGASETKVIYGKTLGDAKYFSLPPEVTRLHISIFNDYLNEISSKQKLFGIPAVVNPKKQLWIKENDAIIAVGDLAVSLEAKNNLNIHKYENATYKIMAVLGLIFEQCNLIGRDNVDIKLATLLPFEEIADKERLYDFLSSKLKSYLFRNKVIKVTLSPNNFFCKPEGAGLVLSRCKLKGESHFTQSKIGILMLGHRNVTSLFFESGTLKQSSSPKLGFYCMVNEIIKNTSGLSEASIIQKIYQAWDETSPYRGSNLATSSEPLPNLIYSLSEGDSLYYPEWQYVYCLAGLANSANKELRAQEAKEIGIAIEKAQKKYIHQIFTWLKENLPNCNEVIISGGTAIFLKPFLEFYFNYALNPKHNKHLYSVSGNKFFKPYQKYTKIIWDEEIRKVITDLLKLNYESDSIRLEDAFGFYGYLTSLS